MRLNKFIAQSGYCSRRKADELTEKGKVKINGSVCNQMGYDVQEDDLVEVEGHIIAGAEKHVYYALNKPAGYVTTNSDEKGRPTAVSLLSDVTARVYPIGRLDYDSCGLLLFTNDGDFSNRIAHPRGEVVKTYLVLANRVLTLEEVNQLRRGVTIKLPDYSANANKPRGGSSRSARFEKVAGVSTEKAESQRRPVAEFRTYKTKPAEVNVVSDAPGNPLYEVKIHEGKNRQVRRMFEAVGASVLELQRTAIGEIQLGRLHEGTYRRLTEREIEYLKNL